MRTPEDGIEQDGFMNHRRIRKRFGLLTLAIRGIALDLPHLVTAR